MTSKKCSRCKKEYNIINFCNSSYSKDGKRSACKFCDKELNEQVRTNSVKLERRRAKQRKAARSEKRREQVRKWQSSETGQIACFNANLKSKYGITIDIHNTMMEKQKNACGACRVLLLDRKHAHVDHCHKTNRVRGILCSACNKALGFAHDRIDKLEGLLSYLRNDLVLNGQIKRRVLVESPYAGDVSANIIYARRATKDCLVRSEIPFTPHLLYTQEGILNDNIPEERKLGIEAGLAWGKVCDASVAYIDYGISHGMQYGIDRAKQEGRPVEIREIGKNPKAPEFRK